MESFEIGEFAKRRRNGAGQLVTLEPEFLQGGHVADLRGNCSGDLIVVDLKGLEAGKLTKFLGKFSSESAISDDEALKILHIGDFRRDGTACRNLAEEYPLKIRHCVDLVGEDSFRGGDITNQARSLVYLEMLQLLKIGDLGTDSTFEAGCGDADPLKVGQVIVAGGNLTVAATNVERLKGNRNLGELNRLRKVEVEGLDLGQGLEIRNRIVGSADIQTQRLEVGKL